LWQEKKEMSPSLKKRVCGERDDEKPIKEMIVKYCLCCDIDEQHD